MWRRLFRSVYFCALSSIASFTAYRRYRVHFAMLSRLTISFAEQPCLFLFNSKKRLLKRLFVRLFLALVCNFYAVGPTDFLFLKDNKSTMTRNGN